MGKIYRNGVPYGGTVAGVGSSISRPSCYYTTERWLRFDPTNRKGLVIKAGTSIRKANGTYENYLADTQLDFTSELSIVGHDYFVVLANDGTITLADEPQTTNVVTIGRFHTLCVNNGTMTMIAPGTGMSTGSKYLIKSYSQVTDPDFYSFYNKDITAVSTGSYYDVLTMAHPLSDFVAGDILPESVFCLSFHPNCLVEDAMVYDKDTDKAIDVYLQSGTGFTTRSKYNATHTVNRQPINHQEDYRMVGKKLLTDHDFTSAALGSNERTAIVGAEDKGTVGGHLDTAGRRMISAIGCEEMCGYLWQWLDEIAPVGGSKWETNVDGRDAFGQHYGVPYVLVAGGDWSVAACCGSRARHANAVRSHVAPSAGGRGSSRVSHVAR